MINKRNILSLLFLSVYFSAFAQQQEEIVAAIQRCLSVAKEQSLHLAGLLAEKEGALPRTFENGDLKYSDYTAWTSGFFPGTLWLLYENFPSDQQLKQLAEMYTLRVEPAKNITTTHDLGFMLNCSFGNAFRITKDTLYYAALSEGTKSLMQRYNDKIGLIKSWETNEKWQYPVIIDNMMNLELLTNVGAYSREYKYVKAAEKHALQTLMNHYRKDNSCYHVVSYDTISGLPHLKGTYQGFSDSSVWARGQAWGLYGYTMMYRETKNNLFLEQARRIARYLVNHPNMPDDKIPYWDFNDPKIPNTYRDVSAATVMASALIELSTLDKSEDASVWLNFAIQQILSLASPQYLAEVGTYGGFILKHSVGNYNKKSEVDVPLTYADYYFVEALLRLKRLAPSPVLKVQNVYNIVDLGANPNGKTLNTACFQAVIDKASNKGGGTIVVPAGRFLVGSLVLKSNVHLYLEKGAVILGSVNPYHYFNLDMPGRPIPDKKDDNSQMALIIAYKADNISITGQGTIDGQGRSLALSIDSLHHSGERIDPNYNIYDLRPNETMRPKLIRLSTCSNVNISGVKLQNSSCWGLSLELCKNVNITKVKILNRAYWNNDGMDISDCKNVLISYCDVNSADDGICLKSYYTGYSNDSVFIQDCSIRSSASAIKFGTASYGGFRNIKINNIKIRDTFRSAIAIESVDGAHIENVEVANLDVKNTSNAIFIRLGHRGGEKCGTIKNVHIHDMKAELCFGRPDIDYDMRGPSITFFHNPFPSSITGIPAQSVENIRIENVQITHPGRASKGMAYMPISNMHMIPEQIKEYPEYHMFRELPSWGFYVRHARGVTFKNVTMKTKDFDFRPAFVFDDANKIIVRNLQIKNNRHSKQIVLKDVSDEDLDESAQNSCYKFN